MRYVPQERRRNRSAGETIRRHSFNGRIPLGPRRPQPHADARFARPRRHLCRNLPCLSLEYLSEPLRHGHGPAPRPPRGREQQFLRPEDRAQALSVRRGGCPAAGILERRTDLEHGGKTGPHGQHLHVAGQRSPDRRASGDRLDSLLVETDLLPTRRLGDRSHDAPRSRDPGAGDVVFRRARRHDAHLRPRFTAGSRPGRTHRLRPPLFFP